MLEQFPVFQVSHPIYSTLFELYRSNDNEARCFVLQFVPVLIWIYLSAMSRRDKQVSNLYLK